MNAFRRPADATFLIGGRDARSSAAIWCIASRPAARRSRARHGAIALGLIAAWFAAALGVALVGRPSPRCARCRSRRPPRWMAAALVALLAAALRAGARLDLRRADRRAADGRRPARSTTGRTNRPRFRRRRFDMLDAGHQERDDPAAEAAARPAAALRPARPRRAARRRLRVAERADDPRLRSHARLQSAAAGRHVGRDRRARLHRGAGQRTFSPLFPLLSLAAGRHDGPALHRVERADRRSRSRASSPATCASSPARATATSTKTRARCRACCSPSTGWRPTSTG